MEVAVLGTMLVPCYYVLHRMFSQKFEDRPSITHCQLKNGDLILFCHNSSRLSHNLANIEYSHMGMVIRWPEDNKLYIMELTTEGDNRHSQNKPGIYDFYERIDRYNGYVSIRSVNEEYRDVFGIPSMIKTFKELDNIDFDYSFTYNFLKKNVLGIDREIDNEYCCSEFIYLFATRLGIIDYDQCDLQDSFRLLCSQFSDIWSEPLDLES